MKLNQLTVTRFLAAFVVIIYHFGAKSLFFDTEFLSRIFVKGSFAVGYFFVLSGFVMIVAYGAKQKKIKIREFYFNRFARIYPIYFVALLMMIAYESLTGKAQLQPFFLNLFLLQAWVPGYTFSCNPAAWSLSVEMLFYLSFPLLFNAFYIKLNSLKVAVLMILVVALLQLFVDYSLFNLPDHQTSEFLIHCPIVRLNQFVLGNFIGLLYKHIKKANYDYLIAINALVIITVLYSRIPNYLENSLTTFLFASFILLLSLNVGKISSAFAKGIFMKAGEVSYGLYILQFPVFYFLGIATQHLKIQQYNNLLFFCFLMFIVAAFSYYFFEVPINRKIKSLRH